jgi:VanZ family protein
MKKQNFFSAILIILILATLAFIWSSSFKTIAASTDDSVRALKLLTPLLEFFVGKGNATDHLVRKIAHFAEFLILGSEFALFLTVRRRVDIQGIANCLFAGLSAAVIDESIQIISNRGSMVSDVLLDFCGVTAGVLLILLFYAVFKPKRRKKF